MQAITDILIEGYTLGRETAPFVIAELSGNHGGSLDRARALVRAAAAAGVHAIKLQTYSPETMTLDLAEREFFIADPANPWSGRSLHALYRQAATPWEWHAELFALSRSLGVIPFSTPFDASAVEFLETLEVPCYKIAAFENNDLPLIRRVAATGKPLLISAGLANLAELDEAVRAARDAGCRDLILMQCSSSYPAPPEDLRLSCLGHWRAMFQCEVGLSDHSQGIGAACAAVALGASVIEKHLVLDRSDPAAVDREFSLEPDELAALVRETRAAWAAVSCGAASAPRSSEAATRNHRRSLYVATDMAPGERFTPQNLRIIRPGLGLPPRYYDLLLGKTVRHAVAQGTPVTWDLVLD